MNIFKQFFSLIFLLSAHALLSQPTATPAPGFMWVLTGTGAYDTGQISTTPGVPSDTSYGIAGDSDPTDCSSYCSGACDGAAYIRKKVFGTTPGFNDSSCEQRAVTLSEWNNTNPDAAVASGATSGTVHLPQTATLTIVQSPSGGASGTGAGGDENRAWIIGGNGPGNSSQFNVQVSYSLDWHIPSFAIDDGSGQQDYMSTYTWGEPGGGNTQETNGWNNNTTDGFGQSFGMTYSIPTTSISQTGASLEVNFVANSSIMISRIFGNADGEAQHGPGMEGRAQYVVNYDIWEIQATVPVDLVRFYGIAQDNNHVQLLWETASEQNSDYFEVQRMNEDKEWKVLDQIKSAGNSSRKMHYEYIDRSITSDSYYRLRQVDFDGAEAYSATIDVKRMSLKKSLLFYPNPVIDELTIQADNLKSIELIDLNGSTVVRSSNAVIDLSALSRGVYYLKCQYMDGFIVIEKIIKS